MDASQFINSEMGRVVEIGGGEWAFVPARLPENLTLDKDIWELLTHAMMCIGQLTGVVRSRLVSSPAVLIRPLQMREAVRSSITEGIDVDGEALMLLDLAQRGRATERHDPQREALNLVRVLDDSPAHDSDEFTSDLVCALHRRLMDGVRGHSKQPGEIRTVQVVIGSDRRFVPPPPHIVAKCLEEWSTWARDDSVRIHPIVRASMLHYHFEAIHPFCDGNGRVGRLLWSLMLARWTALHRPWLYVSPFIERHRREYADGLFGVSARGDWDTWLKFCLRAIAHEAIDSHDRIGALLDLLYEWRELVQTAGLKARVVVLLEALLSRAYIDITTAATLTGSAYNTAKGDLARLETLGIIREVAGYSPTTFVAPDVRRITLEDDWANL